MKSAGRVLVVDDEKLIRWSVSERLTRKGYQVSAAESGERALELLATELPQVMLLDLRLPGIDGIETLRRALVLRPDLVVVMMSAHGTVDVAVEGMKRGAVDFLSKPFPLAMLDAAVSRAHAAAETRRLLACAGSERPAVPGAGGLVGSSPAIERIRGMVARIAESDFATVLVEGESGTGKEVVARAIHFQSARAAKPFLCVNCAALPEHLLESELFGHKRGAFTSADSDKKGLFEIADGGTLFLDEIGDMAPPMQAKLLRALQERVVTPVGGRPIPVDVRVVAATHRDLQQAVRDGHFREDLYYRLGVVPIAIPPLRDRLADIIPLAEHYLALATPGAPPKRLAADAAARLLSHPWPGNVRELVNAMIRAATLVRRPVIVAADLAFLGAGPEATAPTDWLAGHLPDAVARLELEMIRRALAATGGNRAAAAEQLGIRRQLLYQKLARYGLDVSPNGTDAVPDADGSPAEQGE